MGNILESPITQHREEVLHDFLNTSISKTCGLKAASPAGTCSILSMSSRESESVINGTTDYTLRHRLN